MSATNDNSRFWSGLWALLGIIHRLLGRLDRWPVRACLRALVSFPIGTMANSLSNLSGTDNAPLVDLGIAGLSAASLVLLLRWIAGGEGIGYAIKLTFLSWLFVQSLVVAVQTVWIASGMNGTPEPGFVWFLGGIALALFIPTSLLLRRLDPDY
jgi:hypothetical protein